MRRILFILIGISVVGLTSCRKYLWDSGPIIVEERFVDDSYTRVTLKGSMDLIITDDPTYEVRVEASEKKMPFIETRVFNDELVIRERDNNIINDKQIRVFISKTSLNEINLQGSGDVFGEYLEGEYIDLNINGSGDMDLNLEIEDNVDIDIEGSGDVRLEGEANTTISHINGSGDINARYLDSQEAYVFLDGSGDVRVTTFSLLHVEIDGSGDVYYWGDPEMVEIMIEGSGEVFDMQ